MKWKLLCRSFAAYRWLNGFLVCENWLPSFGWGRRRCKICSIYVRMYFTRPTNAIDEVILERCSWLKQRLSAWRLLILLLLEDLLPCKFNYVVVHCALSDLLLSLDKVDRIHELDIAFVLILTELVKCYGLSNSFLELFPPITFLLKCQTRFFLLFSIDCIVTNGHLIKQYLFGCLLYGIREDFRFLHKLHNVLSADDKQGQGCLSTSTVSEGTFIQDWVCTEKWTWS